MFISFFSPLQSLPRPVKTWLPRHDEGKAAILTCEAARILNKCLKNIRKQPRGRECVPLSALPPAAIRHPRHRSSDTLPPWQKTMFTLVTYIFSASYPQPCLSTSWWANCQGGRHLPANVTSFLEGLRKEQSPSESWRELAAGPHFTSPSGSSSSRGQGAQQRHLLCKWPPST